MAKRKEAHAQFTQLKKVLDTSANKVPPEIPALVVRATMDDIENAGYDEEKKRSETMKFVGSLKQAVRYPDSPQARQVRLAVLRKIIDDIAPLLENPSQPTEKDKRTISKITPRLVNYDCKTFYFPIFDKLSAAFKGFSKVLSKQSKPLRKSLGHISKFANKEAIATLDRVPKFLENSKKNFSTVLCDSPDYDYEGEIIQMLSNLYGKDEEIKSGEANALFTHLKGVLDSPPDHPVDVLAFLCQATMQDIDDSEDLQQMAEATRFQTALSKINFHDIGDAFYSKNSEKVRQAEVRSICSEISNGKIPFENARDPISSKDKNTIKQKLAPRLSRYACEKLYFPVVDKLSGEFKKFGKVLSKQSEFDNKHATETLNRVPKFLEDHKQIFYNYFCKEYEEKLPELISKAVKGS